MDLLRIRTLPILAQRNFYREFQHILPWSVLAGLVEGQFASVVVARSFHASALLIGVASATPFASYLASLFWGMLCVGRPKIRLLTTLGAGVVLFAGGLALIPPTPLGLYWFIAQIAVAQVFMCGVVTVRSAVWKVNYPRSQRGRITARLQATRSLCAVVTILIAARLCDWNPNAYRFAFPLAALSGLLGLALVGRVHIRHERRELPRRGDPNGDVDLRTGLVEPFSVTALLSPGRVVGRMIAILRRDHRFARYCLAQWCVGMANLMTTPVVVVVVTLELDLGYAWGFWISAGLIEAVPQLVRFWSIGRWARLFDRVGVIRFRVVNVVSWSFSFAFGAVATLIAVHPNTFGSTTLAVAVVGFMLRGVGMGLGRGGGTLAWNIGHLHFNTSNEAEVYMGIHVFLTGVRGVIFPVLGIWLYQSIGWWVWVVALVCSLLSLSLYSAMAREEVAAEHSARGIGS